METFNVIIFFSILIFLPVLVTAQCLIPADVANPLCDNVVTITELLNYIGKWYQCSSCVPDLAQAMNAYFKIPFCSNCMIDGTDICDDCNTNPGDGCSSECKIESGWECTGEPSVCTQAGVSEEGLAVYHKFDDGIDDNRLEDSSGNDYYAVCSADTCPDTIVGVDGKDAVLFDGIDDFLDIGLSDFGLDESDEMTISFWIKHYTDDYSHIIAKGTYVRPLMISMDNGNVRANMRTDVKTYPLTTSHDLEKDKWYHFAQTYKDGERHLYINGALDRTDSPSGPLSAYVTSNKNDLTHTYLGKVAPLHNGNVPDDERHMNGAVDELMIFTRELSSSEIRYLFDSKNLCNPDTICNNTGGGRENCMNCPLDCPCTSPDKCVYGVCELCIDGDGDGVNRNGGECGSVDCNDGIDTKWKEHEVYVDADNDGYGIGNIMIVCSGDSIPAGCSEISGDCNDDVNNGANINPGETELCDGIDSNCKDGESDATDCESTEICFIDTCIKDQCAEIASCRYYDSTSIYECEFGSISCGFNCTWISSSSTCQQNYAKTYYVDFNEGNDDLDGLTTGTAWKHCPGDQYASGISGQTELKPGDRIIFRGGVKYNGSIMVEWKGNNGNPITYDGNSDGNWGIGKAVINGEGEQLGMAARYLGFMGTYKSYIIIDNFEITNFRYIYDENMPQPLGISFEDSDGLSSNLEIKNCNLNNLKKKAIAVDFEQGITVLEPTTFTDYGQDFSEYEGLQGEAIYNIHIGWGGSDHNKSNGYIGEVTPDGYTFNVYKDINLTQPGWNYHPDRSPIGEEDFLYWVYNIEEGSHIFNGGIGISVEGYRNVFIHDNKIRDVRQGIIYNPYKSDPPANLFIYNNEISHASWGIRTSAGGSSKDFDNVHVYGNVLHDFDEYVKYTYGWHNDGIFLYVSPTFMPMIRNVYIYNNRFYGGISGATGLLYIPYQAENIKVFNNVFAASSGSGTPIRTQALKGRSINNMTVFNNVFFHIPGETKWGMAFQNTTNVTLRNNIIYGFDTYGGIFSVNFKSTNNFSSDNNLLYEFYEYDDAIKFGEIFVSGDRFPTSVTWTLDEWQNLEKSQWNHLFPFPIDHDQNSLLQVDPKFKNYPRYAAKVDLSRTTHNRIYYEQTDNPHYDLDFEVGDYIEFDYDRVPRMITSVGNGYFNFTPDIIVPDLHIPTDMMRMGYAGPYVLNWKKNDSLIYDFSLQSDSLLIDKGTEMTIGVGNIDINGIARPVDGNSDSVAKWDIGAYEYKP